MLSRDNRLRLTEMCCRVKLKRKVSLEERIWMSKLIESDSDARRLAILHLPYRWDIGGVAQWLECLPVTQKVVGSSPITPVEDEDNGD